MKAVLFDLDDTLFDHRYAARCVLQELQTKHASLRAYSLDYLEREDFRILGEKHAAVMAGMIAVDDWRLERVRSLFACCGQDISPDDARLVVEQRQIVYRENRRAVPGAIPLLRLLRASAKIGIVTNNFIKEQEDKLDACGLTSLVDVMVTSEEIRYPKPDAKIFHAVLGRLACDPSEAVMIGDSWEVDVAGALNAGIRAVWFNRDGSPKNGSREVLEISSFEPVEAIAARILGN